MEYLTEDNTNNLEERGIKNRKTLYIKNILLLENNKNKAKSVNVNNNIKEEVFNVENKKHTFKQFLNNKFNFNFLNKLRFNKKGNNIELSMNNINNNGLPELEEVINEVELKARNNRIPKQANHGARPCSSVVRRLRNKTMIRKGNLRTKDEQ